MILWWIGNVVLLVVIVPVVLMLLNRVLRPVREIESYADDVLQHGVALTGTLDAIPKLVTTTELAAVARQNVVRYGASLEKMLPKKRKAS